MNDVIAVLCVAVAIVVVLLVVVYCALAKRLQDIETVVDVWRSSVAKRLANLEAASEDSADVVHAAKRLRDARWAARYDIGSEIDAERALIDLVDELMPQEAATSQTGSEA